MGAARERERHVAAAVIDFTEAMVLRDRVGETFPATVTNVDTRGAVIQIAEPAVLARLGPDAPVELGVESRAPMPTPARRRPSSAVHLDGRATADIRFEARELRPRRARRVGGMASSPRASIAARSTLTASCSRPGQASHGPARDPGRVAVGVGARPQVALEVADLLLAADGTVPGHDDGRQLDHVVEGVGPAAGVALPRQRRHAERAQRAGEHDAGGGHDHHQVLGLLTGQRHGARRLA